MQFIDGFQTYIDVGRCREIERSLEVPLRLLRKQTGCDVAYVICKDDEYGFPYLVAQSASICLFMKGEEISAQLPAASGRLQALPSWRLHSLTTGAEQTLWDVVIVRWNNGHARLWIVLGSLSAASNVPLPLTSTRENPWMSQIQKAHREGCIRTARQLRTMFASALEQLLAAERACDTQELLEVITTGARSLFATSSAYIALPSRDPDRFIFAATDRIKTAGFRHLSLSVSEGIGGLARRQRETARTANYAEDARLEHAPLTETVREGLKSAACTPLWNDGRIRGLLYIAQRDYRAFNNSEIRLLEEYAELCSDALNADQRRGYRESDIRRAERLRLAEALHDSVVGRLLEIGSLPSSQYTRDLVAGVQERTQKCIDAVRECIADMSIDFVEETELGALIARFEKLHCSAHVKRSIVLSAQLEASTRISPSTADTLTVIVGEALANVNRHSKAMNAQIKIEEQGNELHVSVEDDGVGIAESEIGQTLDRKGHLGFARMRSRAQRMGGRCSFGKSLAGGLAVLITLPIKALAND